MMPDNVEKIIMTKEDYDRNVEQLLFDKVSAELERDKYKEILDKIKEKLNVLNEEPYNATTYIMVITEIYKLLEEIE